MLGQLNAFLQKWMPLFTPLSLVIGVLLADAGSHLLFLIPWLFIFMTFVGSLSMNFQSFRTVKQHPWTIVIVLLILHGVMPLWAYILSSLVFHDHLLTVGFVLAVAAPTAITSMIWVSVCGGGVALCLAIILIDTLLAPFFMPVIMHFVVGESITIDTMALMLDLIWMVVVPSIAAILLHEWTKGKIHQRWSPTLAPFQKICLFLVVMINSSAIAPYVQQMNKELFLVILFVLVMAMSGYVVSFLLAHFIWRDRDVVTTVLFTGGMRNIAVAVVIATTYFPPKAIMPVVFGMLFQQVLASFVSKFVTRYKQRDGASAAAHSS